MRSQADDVTDEVRKNIGENYKRELEESDKARESSAGMFYGGMP